MEKTDDRRNDIGSKIIIGVINGTVMLILGLFVHAAWTTANDGKNIGYEVKSDLSAVKVDLSGKFELLSEALKVQKEDLNEIKFLLRREIPKGDRQ